MCRTHLLATNGCYLQCLNKKVSNEAFENNTHQNTVQFIQRGAKDLSKRNITSYGNNFCQDLNLTSTVSFSFEVPSPFEDRLTISS